MISRKSSHAFVLPLLVLIAVILACDAWAIIKGKVVDEDGKPISGAKITVSQGNSTVKEHETDKSGKIDVFGNICPMPGCSADISITVSKSGYQSVTEHFDANKDSNKMRRGDLTIVLTKENVETP